MDANVNYNDVVNMLQTLNVNQRQSAIADGVSNLPDDKKVETVTNAAKTLTPEQQKAAGFFPLPTTKTNDTIWLIVIGSFVSILVGTVAVMAIGFFFDKKFEPTFLTIFTTVSAFLIGLFAQSPVK
jgi:hypothetical protein